MAKVLIVDDNHDLLEFFCILMEKNGFEIRGASSKTEIDTYLQSFNPDLIMIDVMLGNEDGREISKNIKLSHNHIPIILLSGNPEALTNLSEYNIDDVIEKPFTIGTVVSKAQELISKNVYK